MAGRIHIVGIGRQDERLAGAMEHYEKMIGRYSRLTITLVKSPGSIDNKEILLEKEAAIIRARCPESSAQIALAPEGRSFESAGFARELNRLHESGLTVVFIIGGAYGLEPALKAQCREIISLSPLTFSHQLCLLVLLEQIYRAFTILNHHPYHK
jgi:23S rRNA (pseudouridine1915-N3)-methyltransferase